MKKIREMLYDFALQHKLNWFKRYYLVCFVASRGDSFGPLTVATCLSTAYEPTNGMMIQAHKEQHKKWGYELHDVQFFVRLNRKDYVNIDTSLKTREHNTTAKENK